MARAMRPMKPLQMPPVTPSAMRPGRGPAAVLALLLAAPVLVEAVLWAADAGLVGARSWRGTAYGYGAFWSGLLRGWVPNYEAQPAAMFLTYALLHGGPGHLAGNLAAAVPLGLVLGRRLGAGGLAVAWIVAALGGAAAFGLLSDAPQPMVGASGATFGLAGALQAIQIRDRGLRGAPLWPVGAAALALVAANGAVWWWEEGLLAWEAHLGGWLAGCAIGAFWRMETGHRADRRRHPRNPGRN